MSNKRADISQIRKYLNGELDARSMHQLEREALDDPFLADAIEGYAQKPKNDDDALADTSARLKKRIAPPAKRVVLWPLISIAASVLIFMAVGGWWFLRTTPAANDPQNRIAKDKTVVVKSPAAPLTVAHDTMPKQELAILKPATPKPLIQATPAVGNAAAEVMADKQERKQAMAEQLLASESAAKAKQQVADTAMQSKTLNDVVVVGYGVQKKVSVTGASTTINTTDITKSANNSSVTSALAGRVAGVKVEEAKSAANAPVAKGMPGSSGTIQIRGVTSLKDTSRYRMLTGKVFSKGDGLPLPYANVAVAGKNFAVQANLNGEFKIPVTDQDQLLINSVGYLAQKVAVNKKENLKVLLEESSSALAEVVITRNDNHKDAEDKEPEYARPTAGWSDFKRYLNEKAISPDGKTGTVKVSFMVNPDNSITDIKVTKSLSKAADQKAVDIIKDGPSWLHNSDGNSEKVSVKITFRKE